MSEDDRVGRAATQAQTPSARRLVECTLRAASTIFPVGPPPPRCHPSPHHGEASQATGAGAVEQDQPRCIAREYLYPLFSGARLAGGVLSTAWEQLVARPGPRLLALKVHGDDLYRLGLCRGEKFGRIAVSAPSLVSSASAASASAWSASAR